MLRLIKTGNFDIINFNSDLLEKYDIYHFNSLLTFFIEFHRFNEHKRFEEDRKNQSQKINSSIKNKPRLILNVDYIKECFIPPILELAYG